MDKSEKSLRLHLVPTGKAKTRAALAALLLNIGACAHPGTQPRRPDYYQPSLSILNRDLQTPNLFGVHLRNVWQTLLAELQHSGTAVDDHLVQILEQMLHCANEFEWIRDDATNQEHFGHATDIAPSENNDEQDVPRNVYLERYRATAAQLTIEERAVLIRMLGEQLQIRPIAPEFHDQLLNATASLIPHMNIECDRAWWNSPINLTIYGITLTERNQAIVQLKAYYSDHADGSRTMVGNTDPQLLIEQLRIGVLSRATIKDLDIFLGSMTLSQHARRRSATGRENHNHDFPDVNSYMDYILPNPALIIKLNLAILQEYYR